MQDVVYKFSEEIYSAMKNLLKVADVDPDSVDVENVGSLKSTLASKHLSLHQLSDSANVDRTLIEIRFRDKFLAGYLVYLNMNLNVIRRIRLDNVEERITALIFLKGGDNFESSSSNKR